MDVKNITVISALAIALVLSLVATQSAFATSGTLAIVADTTLTEDHYGNVAIAADGVTLDCAGYSITSAVSGSGIGVHMNERSDSTVQNCVIIDFGRGILVEESSGINLLDNTAEDV